MNVIHVTLVIQTIPYRMFPKPPLPDTSFPFIHAALGTALGFRQLAGKGVDLCESEPVGARGMDDPGSGPDSGEADAGLSDREPLPAVVDGGNTA